MFIYLKNMHSLEDAMAFSQTINDTVFENMESFIENNAPAIRYTINKNPSFRVKDLFELKFVYWNKYHLLGLYSEDLWITRHSYLKKYFDATIWTNKSEIDIYNEIPLININIPKEHRNTNNFSNCNLIINMLIKELHLNNLQNNYECITYILNCICSDERCSLLKHTCEKNIIREKIYSDKIRLVYTTNVDDQITQIIGFANTKETALEMQNITELYLDNNNRRDEDVFIHLYKIDEIIPSRIDDYWNQYNKQRLLENQYDPAS